MAQVITAFITSRSGQEFHASEIRNACALALGFTNVAPGSPDRVMRDLRQRNRINYELLNRAKSLYRALPLDTIQEEK